jgi:2-polyprenyl-6-methoxyphenol hydroxylase-like FAD-dependent oxidoreductase
MFSEGKSNTDKTVLISGGGIAGLTLAYWLQRGGFQPTIIELASHLRIEGYAIDFAGTGWDVAERMGLISELRSRQNILDFFIFKDRNGRTTARLPVEALRQSFHGKLIQIMRQNLEHVLYQAVRDTVEIRFGTTINHIEQSADGALVSCSDGTEGYFGLVVGADGIHSHVRRLVFGEESQFAKYLGYYAAAFPVPNLDHFEAGFVNELEPDRQAGAYPAGDGTYSALLVYRTANTGFIPHARRKATLQGQYQDAGWVVPELIDSIAENTPVYLDTVTQIRMPRWCDGRVVLIGDAAHCLTLISGQGAASAMGGAYILAEELCKTDTVQAACVAYERRVRPFVEDKQRKARRFARTFVPRNALEIQLNYLMMKLLFTPWLGGFIGKQFGVDSLLQGA